MDSVTTLSHNFSTHLAYVTWRCHRTLDANWSHVPQLSKARYRVASPMLRSSEQDHLEPPPARDATYTPRAINFLQELWKRYRLVGDSDEPRYISKMLVGILV
jgi:hypothetical protein